MCQSHATCSVRAGDGGETGAARKSCSPDKLNSKATATSAHVVHILCAQAMVVKLVQRGFVQVFDPIVQGVVKP